MNESKDHTESIEPFLNTVRSISSLSPYALVYLAVLSPDEILIYHSKSQIQNNALELFPLHDFLAFDEADLLSNMMRNMPAIEQETTCSEKSSLKMFFKMDHHGSSIDKSFSHKLVVIDRDNNGYPITWLGVAVPFINKRKSFQLIGTSHSNYYKYILNENTWKLIDYPPLPEYLMQTLILAMQGLTIKEVSQSLFRSVSTIKNYHKQIFEYFRVDSIQEAISIALFFGIV